MGSPDAVLGESTTQQQDMASSLPHFSDDAALKVFVTVGSTRFDDLIKATGLSKPFLERLAAASASLQPEEQSRDGVQVHVIAQYGTSDIASILVESSLADQDDPSTIAQPMPTREDPKPALGQTGKLNLTISSSDGSPGGAALVESLVVNGFVSVQRERDVKISLFKFASDLRSYMLQADLVVSHAGSGTILEVLRLPSARDDRKRQLVIVPNSTLMDNHQAELGLALAGDEYGGPYCHVADVRSIDAVAASAVEQLQARESQLRPFPAPDARRLAALIDEEMGFLA